MISLVGEFLGTVLKTCLFFCGCACVIFSFSLISKIKQDCQPQNGKIIHRAYIIRDSVTMIASFTVGIVTAIGMLWLGLVSCAA